jgi:hypothetical protein
MQIVYKYNCPAARPSLLFCKYKLRLKLIVKLHRDFAGQNILYPIIKQSGGCSPKPVLQGDCSSLCFLSCLRACHFVGLKLLYNKIIRAILQVARYLEIIKTYPAPSRPADFTQG